MFNPVSSRPRVFRQPRLLMVGCGDVGTRVLRVLGARMRVQVLVRDPAQAASIRALGARPLAGDLDDPRSLGRLGALAPRLMHLAPPPGEGTADTRTRALVRAMARGGVLRQVVYASTSGVYGDAGGAWVPETRPLAPATDRARRRVDAEAWLRGLGRAGGARVTALRIPGIYAADRPGGDPRERLRRGTPVLQHADDVVTNHIHADDLARVCLAALWRGRPQRAVNVADASSACMGEHFDTVADLFGLPRPPRVSREVARRELSPMQMSFLSESRRLDTTRLRTELKVVLRYPTVREGLAEAARDAAARTP